MTIAREQLKNSTEKLVGEKSNLQTDNKSRNLQLPKRREMIKTIAATSLMAPCALVFGTKLNAESSLPEEKRFSSKLLDFINEANLPEVSKVVEFNLENQDMPWTKELFKVKEGQQITFLLDGKWWFSKEHNMWVEPGIVFHAKVSNEDYYNAGSNTGTMTASKNGRLTIARSLGEFKNPKGELSYPEDVYKKGQGYVDGVAILWEGDALDGLYKLSAQGDISGIIHREIQRQVYVPPLPKGWKNIFLFDNLGLFFQTGPREISCHTHKNVGILQKDVDVPITNKLKFTWDWIVEQLPSKLPETNAGTHDYLSIAIKFDDGQDLTYMWSSSVEKELHFRCPLHGWKEIETHLVQRSGEKDLNKWLNESRNVEEDYKKTIGGKAKKVVQVWFIANTLFMRGTGKCKYSNIEFHDGNKKIVVL